MEKKWTVVLILIAIYFSSLSREFLDFHDFCRVRQPEVVINDIVDSLCHTIRFCFKKKTNPKLLSLLHCRRCFEGAKSVRIRCRDRSQTSKKKSICWTDWDWEEHQPASYSLHTWTSTHYYIRKQWAYWSRLWRLFFIFFVSSLD